MQWIAMDALLLTLSFSAKQQKLITYGIIAILVLLILLILVRKRKNISVKRSC